MAKIVETRSDHRTITIQNYEPDAEIVGNMAHINGPNGLTYVCYVDDIFLRAEGMLGRVSIPQSVDLLTTEIENMDGNELARFVEQISEDRGIHSGRLALSLKYNHPTSDELAWNILAHHFNMSKEALICLSTENNFRNMPPAQAEGLIQRLSRNGRLEVVQKGLYNGLKPNSTHLLSNRKILVIK
ncbi:hypothetical protein HZC27_00665 [Candidatus Roizmanbacteria bacterium]|nr:hypothetical protein [Candidatus Roizmanbacteria bacterium]